MAGLEEIDVILLLSDDEAGTNREGILLNRLDSSFLDPIIHNILKTHSNRRIRTTNNSNKQSELESQLESESDPISVQVACVVYSKDHPNNNNITTTSKIRDIQVNSSGFKSYHPIQNQNQNSTSSIIDLIPRSYSSSSQPVSLDLNIPSSDWKDEFECESDIQQELDHRSRMNRNSDGNLDNSVIELDSDGDQVEKESKKSNGNEKEREKNHYNHHRINLIQALKSCLELFQSRSNDSNTDFSDLEPEILGRYLIHFTSSYLDLNHHQKSTQTINETFLQKTYSPNCFDSKHDFWNLEQVCKALGNGNGRFEHEESRNHKERNSKIDSSNSDFLEEEKEGLNVAILTLLIQDSESLNHNNTNSNPIKELDLIDSRVHSLISGFISNSSSSVNPNEIKSENPFEFFIEIQGFSIPQIVKQCFFNGWIKNLGGNLNVENQKSIGNGNDKSVSSTKTNSNSNPIPQSNHQFSASTTLSSTPQNQSQNQNQFQTINQSQNPMMMTQNQIQNQNQTGKQLDHSALKNQFLTLQQQITALLQNLSTLHLSHQEELNRISREQSELAVKGNLNPPGLSKETIRKTQLLEGFRRAIISQQTLLRNAAEIYRSGNQPELSNIFSNLIKIEKESKNQGIEIKGSWNLPSSFSNKNSMTISGNKSTVTSTTNQVAGGQTQIWWGTLVWSINQNVPDPNGGMINGQPKLMIQKKDVMMGLKAVLPNGHSITDKLLLPWPSKLLMTTVLNISSTDMQSVARSKGLPSLFFNPAAINPTSSEDEISNESIFRSLCRSLESKNLCAFLSHDPKNPNNSDSNGADNNNGSGSIGIALVPFNFSSNNGNGQSSRDLKLIGIVFNEPFHFPAPAEKGNANQQQQQQQQNYQQQQHHQQQQPQLHQNQQQQQSMIGNNQIGSQNTGFNNKLNVQNNSNQDQNLGLNSNFNPNNQFNSNNNTNNNNPFQGMDLNQLQLLMQQSQNQGGNGNGQLR